MSVLSTRLPTPLSQRIANAASAILSRQGREVDCALGGIPFRLATSGDIPMSVETIPVRKDQFDTENDPGEQSLTGWWRRSQSSFHEGAGSLYQEDSAQNIASNNFFDSEGIDVWTQGQIKLIHRMVEADHPDAAYSHVRSYAANSLRYNLSPNPSAEVNITGFTAGGTQPPTLSQSDEQAFNGTYSVKVVWDNGGTLPLVQFPTITTTIGQRYTVSAHVYVPTGSPDVLIVGPATFGEETDVKDEWVRLTVSFEATDTSHECQVWPSTPPSASDLVYVDAILSEEGNITGSYFDGNSPNATWDGVADESTSTETYVASSVSGSAIADGTLHTSDDLAGPYAELHAPVGKTLTDGLVVGTHFYDVASDGTLYEGTLASPGTATTWPLGTGPERLIWGKHRLWVIGGRKLWQPDLTDAGGTNQDPIFTHPNLGWKYTCMTEAPSAMLFGGHDGFQSTIQAVTLDDGGGIPALSGAAVTASLPDGELVQELATLAGQYIGIGTTRGFRVGVVQQNGTITYGPLIIEPDGIEACTAVAAQGRFFVVAFRVDGGNAKAYRVDTSIEVGEGVFPYASDIDCGLVGAITSLVSTGRDQLICTTSDGNIYYQSLTEYVDSGWLQTGRVRYRTTEPKQFRYVHVETEPLNGRIAVEFIEETGTSLPIGSITRQGEVFTDKLAIQLDRMKHGALRFTLRPTDDLTESPVLNSYLLRATPAITPQRLYTLPLLCFDKEQARSGQWYGGEGYASDRLQAVHMLEDLGEALTYQDFSATTSGGRLVTIETARFIQTAPAAPFRAGGAGGILVLQLRTVDA